MKESSNIFLIFSVFYFVWYPSPEYQCKMLVTLHGLLICQKISLRKSLKYAMLLLK